MGKGLQRAFAAAKATREKRDALPPLGDDAMMLLGCLFGTGLTDLTFHMQESRPSDRAQAALDELVSKTVLVKESINQAGGVRYKPRGFDLKSAIQFSRKHMDNAAMSFPINQPI